MPPPRSERAASVLLTLISAFTCTSLPACLVDTEERCGEHSTLEDDRCICDEGYGLEGNRCVACGKHEEGSLAGCVCEKGFTRPNEGAPCVEVGGLGSQCASDAECLDEAFPYCQLAEAPGYCTTRDCESSDECDTALDYACNTRESPSFCERPASGLGTACDDSADCADFEAGFCEALVSRVCLPGGCKSELDKCHGDWVCCDIPILGDSICIPPAELESGKCPAEGTLIERPQ